MRSKWIRAAALLMALLLTVSPAALASEALGTELSSNTINLGQGVNYTSRSFWSATHSDQRVERYLEYTPNAVVQPAVSYGSYVVSKSTVTSMARTLEAQGKRVLGGINGDYYVLATGAPLGMVVTDGILRSSSADVLALGFDKDGHAFIGMPNLSITAAFHGQTYSVAGGLNKVRTTAGYFLYSSDYYSSTYHSSSAKGVDVILTPSTANAGQTVEGTNLVYSSKPIVNGRLTCTVDQVLHSTGSISIPSGKLVMTINNESNANLVSALSSLKPGETVDISISAADSRWASAVTTIGGLYKMVTNGKVDAGLETTAAPRTAVGIRPDGSTIFYTIDGRQSGYSIGATMVQVAQRLVELGCTEAICLDGGGSTTFGVTMPGASSFTVVNRPSDGAQRAVANALFLTQAPPGIVQSLRLSPSTQYVMPGGQVSFTASGIDVTGKAIQSYSGSELTFASTNAGSGANGVFTFAQNISGAVTVTASVKSMTASAQFTVVNTPDTITLLDEATGAEVHSVALKTGGQLSLTAHAAYQDKTLAYRDESFTWSVTEGLGTIDQSGTFTASDAGGTGFLTVSAGERSVSVPVLVGGHINTVEDFEGSFGAAADSANASAAPESGPEYVRYGSQSVRIDYDTSEEEFASVGVPMALLPGEAYLQAWVYGDGSGNTLAVSVTGMAAEDAGDAGDTVPGEDAGDAGDTDDTVPGEDAGDAGDTDDTVPGEDAGDAGDTDGTVPGEDTEDPEDTGDTVPGEDAGDAGDTEDIDDTTVTWDVPLTTLDFTGWRQVSAPLPEQAEEIQELVIMRTGAAASGTIWLDQITTADREISDLTPPVVTARQEGNTLTAAVQDNVDTQFQPAQIRVTWDGEPLAFTLAGNTVTASLPAGGGAAHRVTVTVTDASGNIGRGSAEIAASGSASPFPDMAGHWAESFVSYLYSQGVVSGTLVNGVQQFQPNRAITRGEFALMTARWMGVDLTGYSGVELPFADAASIPSWSLDAVKAMYALGMMQGSEDHGLIYAYADRSITRAEAMTMLGRVQPKGYASAELDFTDASAVPDWAAAYIQTMVAQGVVSGYDNGTIRPQASITRGEVAKVLYSLR